MTPAKENLAYDFSLFEAKEDREVGEEESQATEKQKKVKTAHKTKVRPASAVRWTAASLFILMSLLVIMVCNVQLNSLNDEISKAQTQLEASQSEQVRLNMELESRTSLSSVESYAVNQKGLQKSSQYQMTYIHLTDQDEVDITPKSGNIFTRFFDFILAYL